MKLIGLGYLLIPILKKTKLPPIIDVSLNVLLQGPLSLN